MTTTGSTNGGTTTGTTTGSSGSTGGSTDLDLDVDTNRNGIVDSADDDFENSQGATWGAIYTVNYDRDNNRKSQMINGLSYPSPDSIEFEDDGYPKGYERSINPAVQQAAWALEDRRVENAADVRDMMPLWVRKIPASYGVMGQDYDVYLKIQDDYEVYKHRAIRVFPSNNIGQDNQGFFGGVNETRTEVKINNLLSTNSDTKLLVEGLYLAGMYIPTPVQDHPDNPPGTRLNLFDGKIKLRLELRHTGNWSHWDDVMIKVAPYIMIPNSQYSSETWVYYGGNDNGEFRGGLTQNSAAEPVYGTLSQWMQDHVEVGYTERPMSAADGRNVQQLVFRLPYRYNGSNGVYSPPYHPWWPLYYLLKPNVGVFNVYPFLEPFPERGSAEFGGNVELFGAGGTMGRIVMGDSANSFGIVGKVLRGQEIQADMTAGPPSNTVGMYDVSTKWLSVGHADEVLNLTYNKSKPTLASPGKALTKLQSIAENQRGRYLFFTKQNAETVLVDAIGIDANNRWIQISNPGSNYVQGAELWYRVYDGPGAGQTAKGILSIETLPNNSKRYWLGAITIYNTGSKLLGAAAPNYSDPSYYDMLNGTSFPYSKRSDGSGGSPAQWLVAPYIAEDVNNNIQEQKGKIVIFQDPLFFENGAPMAITLKEVLDNTTFVDYNTRLQTHINDRVKSVMNTCYSSDPNYSLIELPQLYVGRATPNFSEQEISNCWAFTPNMTNYQVIGQRLFVPRTYGPKKNGTDLLQSYGVELFTNANITAVNWVETFYFYHLNAGGAHCATASVRPSFSTSWWTP